MGTERIFASRAAGMNRWCGFVRFGESCIMYSAIESILYPHNPWLFMQLIQLPD